MEDVIEKDELTLLKERADKLNITYSPGIKAPALKKKIDAVLNEEDETEDTTETEDVVDVKPLTKGQMKAKARREASELVRVVVACMNPNKREWEGEIISVGNSVVGNFKKFVPFNIEEGYHIPKAIYNYLVERECQIFVNGKDARGNKTRVGKLIKEFNITVLDPLTEEELKDLAQNQAVTQALA